MDQSIELSLQRWKPDRENLVSLLGSLHAPQMSVVGSWVMPSHFDWSALRIEEQGEKLAVHFSTGGCLNEWKLERTAEYQEGVLRLNFPVVEYCPLTYDTLYPIQIDGTDYLFTQAAIRFEQRKYESIDFSKVNDFKPSFVFRRDTETVND